MEAAEQVSGADGVLAARLGRTRGGCAAGRQRFGVRLAALAAVR